MNPQTAKILCDINDDFYRGHHEGFSATRQGPWPGWKSCLDLIEQQGVGGFGGKGAQGRPQDCCVFDLACGNLRFEAFLQSQWPDAAFKLYALDNCDALVPPTPKVHYQNLDVLGLLLKGRTLSEHYRAPRCDLAVCFGFMHHVPSMDYRGKIMQSLLQQSRSGGYVVVSFWQFMENQHMAKKARATHAKALESPGLAGLVEDLDANDYLIGWNDLSDVYRYCHSFTEEEIDKLLKASCGNAKLIARFKADGRTGNLNIYVVLQVA